MEPAEMSETQIALHDFFEIKTTNKNQKKTINKIIDGWDLQGALDNFQQISDSVNNGDRVTLTYYVTTLVAKINGESPGISFGNGKRFGVIEFAPDEVQKIISSDWLEKARSNARQEIDEHFKTYK